MALPPGQALMVAANHTVNSMPSATYQPIESARVVLRYSMKAEHFMSWPTLCAVHKTCLSALVVVPTSTQMDGHIAGVPRHRMMVRTVSVVSCRTEVIFTVPRDCQRSLIPCV